MFRIEKTKKFSEDMKILTTESQKKVEKKVNEILIFNPYRYEALEGNLFKGIRKMRMGVKEFKNGVRILYTVCEDCNEYSHSLCEKLRETCNFSGNGVVKLLRMKPRTDDTYTHRSIFG